jgi:Flp pilus assembly protein TadG
MRARLGVTARLGEESGQSMTELALVLPVLMLILFAIIQFGIAFNNYVTLTDAVRAGARTAAVSRGVSDPEGAVETAVDTASADLDTSKVDVDIKSNWGPGDDVTVTAKYPYSISLFGLIVSSGDLKSTVTERVE